MRIFTLLLTLLFNTYLFAQLELPASFLAQSAQYGLQWPALEDPTYDVKLYEPDPILDQHFDLGIYNSKEKYRVLIFFKVEGEPPIPHIKATLRANHFSNNMENSFVAIHTLMPDGLEKYNVDWGGIYYFNPKSALTEAFSECQLVSLFKLGKGAVYLLYLFDDFAGDVEEMVWNPVFGEVEEN